MKEKEPKVVYKDKIVEVEKVIIREVEKLVEKETVDAKMVETARVIDMLKGVVEKLVINEKVIGVPVGYVETSTLDVCKHDHLEKLEVAEWKTRC